MSYAVHLLNLTGAVLATYAPAPAQDGLGAKQLVWHPSGTFLAIGGFDDIVRLPLPAPQ